MIYDLVFHIPQKQVYASLFITLVLCVVCIIVGIKVKHLKPSGKTPKWLVPFIMIVDIMNKLAKANFGKRWKIYAPYLLTLTMFIFFSNICGVVGLDSPTSYLVINACLALISFLVIQLTGIISMGPGKYLKSFIEPIPVMLPINIISEFTLPISLALRLMGNIISGGVITSMIKGIVGIHWWAAFIVIPIMPLLNLIFDLFSGTIQTLVFVLLTTIYGGLKVDDKDKIYDESGNLINTEQEKTLVEENA